MKTVIAGVALSFFLLVLPVQALAATNSLLNPIVPEVCHCENQKAPDGTTISTAPSYGCVLQTVQNGVNVLISIAILVCVLWLAYAGTLFMASSASPGLREQGKTRIMNAVIGIMTILAAWLIVDFVMKTLYNEGSQFGPWNSILAGKSDGSDACIVAKNPISLTSGTLSIVAGVPVGTSAGGATGVVSGTTGTSKLNISAATQYAATNAAAKSQRLCASYVRKALAAGGLTQFNSGQGDAWQYGGPLTSAGFSSIYTSTYTPGQTVTGIQAGDVVVFQKAPPQPGHPLQYGHIAIYDGSQWISDFKQGSTMAPTKYNGISFTVYRP